MENPDKLGTLFVHTRRIAPYQCDAYFKKKLSRMAARSGLGDQYVHRAMDLYPRYRQAFLAMRVPSTRPGRVKMYGNNPPCDFLARKLLILVGAPIRQPKRVNRYASMWEQICNVCGWKYQY